jgi:hypothetical protein
MAMPPKPKKSLNKVTRGPIKKKTSTTFSTARDALASRMGAEGPKGNSVKKVNRPSGSGTIKKLGKPMIKSTKKK